MRFKVPILLFCFAVLMCFAGEAQAGALRTAGKEIVKGSQQVASVTANGAGAAASSVASATTTTGGAVKSGAATVGNGVAAASHAAWGGTKTAVHKVYKAVW